LAWFGVVWRGLARLARFGVVWRGLAWFGVVWRGFLRVRSVAAYAASGLLLNPVSAELK